MKKVTFLLMLFSIGINAQSILDTLKVREYMDTTSGGLHYYGAAEQFPINKVSEDFGPRDTREFHGGGDALHAVEDGTITQLDGEGYKFVVIEGNNGHHYGYGHIFREADPGNSHIKSGNFVLKKVLHTNANSPDYAIINLQTCTAIAENSGDTVVFTTTFCQDTLITVDTVTAGQAIAPIGDSSGGADFPVHLHFYRFRQPNLNGNSVIQATNCIDPWTTINHPVLLNLNGYDLEAHTFGEPDNTIIVNYPATTYQTIRLKASMTGAVALTYSCNNGQTCTDNSRYNNTVMAINEARLLVKPVYAQNYTIFQGPRYERPRPCPAMPYNFLSRGTIIRYRAIRPIHCWICPLISIRTELRTIRPASNWQPGELMAGKTTTSPPGRTVPIILVFRVLLFAYKL